MGFGLYLLVSLYIFVFIFEVLIFGISLKKFFIYEYKFFCMGFVVYLVMLYGDVDELLVFGVRGWCWLYINVQNNVLGNVVNDGVYNMFFLGVGVVLLIRFIILLKNVYLLVMRLYVMVVVIIWVNRVLVKFKIGSF